ncbi:MAG TPA: MFS transporter [Actinomycetes bacterium]|jgi:MFS family permease|nr:MFS transporter [Actinomycetes bacterium]
MPNDSRPEPEPEVSRWLLRRDPQFARLWAAKAISHIGDGAALVALVLHVQESQRTGVTVSALLLANTLPTLLGPLAGAVADRVDQRRLMIGAAVGQALVYGAMGAAPRPFPALLALVATASILATLFAPAARSAVPTLISSRDLVRANAWMGIALTFQGAIGPVVGGLLIAVAGIRGALWGNALSFAVSAALLRTLPPLPPEAAEEDGVGLVKGTGEGLRYALRHPVARVLVIGLGFGVLFAAVDDVALVFLAREDLSAGALGYGILASVYGVGFALGSFALMLTHAGRAVGVFTLGLLLTGAGGLATGLAPAVGLAALAQAVAGSGNGLEVVATDTLVQGSVPRSHRGRVFGVVSAATLLGGAVARGLGGVLLDLTSARTTFMVGGCGVLVVTVITVVLFRGAAPIMDE